MKDQNLSNANTPLVCYRHLKIALVTFLALALFDAILGGSISALLRIEGWFPLDQRINDVYQLNYGIIITATLVWLYSQNRSTKPSLTIFVLFVGYVEDTLFYLLIPLVNPIIKFITKGVEFELETGTLFPEKISGWAGWMGRTFIGRNISFDMPVVFVFNFLAIVVVWLLWKKS
jgi:hypothetical protein